MKILTVLKSLVLISLFFSQPENVFAQGWYSQRKESQNTRKRGGVGKNNLKKENADSTPKKTANEIKLVTTGSGDTRDNAILSALRSAIEQTYGTFVSANTALVNDELVKDEIVSISSGNVKKYNVIYESQNNGEYTVTVDAVVSIGNLISFAKSKGAETELSGATFAMNMKMEKLNRENEAVAVANLVSQVCEICETISLYDYSIEVSEPKIYSGIKCDFKVFISPNENAKIIEDLIHKTLSSLSISPKEAQVLIESGYHLAAYDRDFTYGIERIDLDKYDDIENLLSSYKFEIKPKPKQYYILRHVYDFGIMTDAILKYKYIFRIADDLGEYSPLILTSTAYNECQLVPFMLPGRNKYDSYDWWQSHRNEHIRASLCLGHEELYKKRTSYRYIENDEYVGLIKKKNIKKNKKISDKYLITIETPIYYREFLFEKDLVNLESFEDVSLLNDRRILNGSRKTPTLSSGRYFNDEVIFGSLYYTEDEISRISTIKVAPYIN